LVSEFLPDSLLVLVGSILRVSDSDGCTPCPPSKTVGIVEWRMERPSSLCCTNASNSLSPWRRWAQLSRRIQRAANCGLAIIGMLSVSSLFRKAIRSRTIAEFVENSSATRARPGSARWLAQDFSAPLLSGARAIFAACRGRVILADDMGLGKTVQALAATELLRRSRGIQPVLIVAPASVKYQWKNEIEKFTGLDAQVVTPV
jgi:hypothetical protein